MAMGGVDANLGIDSEIGVDAEIKSGLKIPSQMFDVLEGVLPAGAATRPLQGPYGGAALSMLHLPPNVRG